MIKPRVFVPLCLAAAMSLAIGSGPTSAQGVGKSAAVVDIQRILKESMAAKSVRQQVSTMTKRLTEEARKARGELRAAKKDLANKRAILSPERFAQLRRELAQKAKNRQLLLNNSQRGIDRSVSAAMGKIQEVFAKITAEIADERKLIMVFRKTAVVLSPRAMDITADVLKRLDKRMPKVAVVAPK